jgi:hypothetical protein
MKKRKWMDADAVGRRDALREALFDDHLGPIVEAAESAAVDVPQLSRIRLPGYSLQIDRLVAISRKISDNVTPYAHALIRMGLALDFVAQLDAAIDELELETATIRASRRNPNRMFRTPVRLGHSQASTRSQCP